MTSSGNNFNDFPELVPTREITTKMEKTFLFLVYGRGPISWMGIKAAASIAPTLIRHWAKLGMFVVGEFWAHVFAILHCSLRTQFRELEFSSVQFISVQSMCCESALRQHTVSARIPGNSDMAKTITVFDTFVLIVHKAITVHTWKHKRQRYYAHIHIAYTFMRS